MIPIFVDLLNDSAAVIDNRQELILLKCSDM